MEFGSFINNSLPFLGKKRQIPPFWSTLVLDCRFVVVMLAWGVGGKIDLVFGGIVSGGKGPGWLDLIAGGLVVIRGGGGAGWIFDGGRVVVGVFRDCGGGVVILVGVLVRNSSDCRCG
mmetsp:Transcript_3748/g.4066  ORF Transcript_3748/g.4066 Transcript_3748/m.4066 type:complete len:118 (+) Transcript_3748:349-702(+)